MNKLYTHIQKGFTLIEVMVAVLIVGILAAISITSYQTYVIKSQVEEGILFLSEPKVTILEYFYNKQQLPLNNETLGYTSSKGKYIASTYIEDGEIFAVFGESARQTIHGKYVKLTPVINGSNITWTCSSDLDSKYLPGSCKETISDDTGNGGNNEENPDNNGGNDNNGGDNGGNEGNPGNEPEEPEVPVEPEPETPVTPEPPVDNTGKVLTPEQSSKYPEVNNAYQRYFNNAAQAAQYKSEAATLRQQAQQAQQAGNFNQANQLNAQAGQKDTQASQHETQMSQSLTQYNQAIEIYKGRNNGTLPSDFPVAPRL